jgi:hypothetical protein
MEFFEELDGYFDPVPLTLPDSKDDGSVMQTNMVTGISIHAYVMIEGCFLISQERPLLADQSSHVIRPLTSCTHFPPTTP